MLIIPFPVCAYAAILYKKEDVFPLNNTVRQTYKQEME